MPLVANSLAVLRTAAATVSAWSARRKLIAGGGVLLVAAIALWVGVRSGGCSSRADVEARVAAIAAAVQADAAQDRISIEELADRIKQLNAAATAFERSQDLGTYCDALDALDEKFEPLGGR